MHGWSPSLIGRPAYFRVAVRPVSCDSPVQMSTECHGDGTESDASPSVFISSAQKTLLSTECAHCAETGRAAYDLIARNSRRNGTTACTGHVCVHRSCAACGRRDTLRYTLLRAVPRRLPPVAFIHSLKQGHTDTPTRDVVHSTCSGARGGAVRTALGRCVRVACGRNFSRQGN